MLQKRLTVFIAVLLMSLSAAVPAMQQNTVIASAAENREAEEVAGSDSKDSKDTKATEVSEETKASEGTEVTAGETAERKEADSKAAEEAAKVQEAAKAKEAAAKKAAQKKAKAKAKRLAAKKAKAAREAARIEKATSVNAKHLTKEYKREIAKARKNSIHVSRRNYKSRIKAEEKALIDLSYAELAKNSQVHITRKSFDLMCRVVRQEAGPVSYYTQEMVAEVIVHRAMKLKGKDQIYKALTAKGQFSCIHSSVLYRNSIDGQIVNACKDALLNSSHPKSLMFFRAGYFFHWCKPYKKSEGTFFSLA